MGEISSFWPGRVRVYAIAARSATVPQTCLSPPLLLSSHPPPILPKHRPMARLIGILPFLLLDYGMPSTETQFRYIFFQLKEIIRGRNAHIHILAPTPIWFLYSRARIRRQ